DIRDILILINYFFTGKIEDLFHKPLHDYEKKFSEDIQIERIDMLLSQNYNPEIYLFLYENKILEYVVNGNVQELSNMIFKLSNGVVPVVSGDNVRSEKNYSIVVFEKLAQAAINMGMDLINAYQSRDSFIRKNELCINLKEVLKVRDTAIVFYTSEIGKAKVRNLSPQISSIVQYIGLNMYTKITVRQIAQYFSMSEARLRTAFKKEMNISIHNYILRRKISEAKVMLKSNYPINDISLLLGFSDTSHFTKVFKKITGTTPKKYQMSVDSKFTLNLD
ncbi:YSIRK-targeted surface antigen transcriptional regulator, partial [Enterococcus faecalis]|nr:YSIRK-targeted surface antigen transcriptional regulator [Enterococcus faecalis]